MSAPKQSSTRTVNVIVHFLSALRDQVGRGEEVVALPAGSTLRDLADYLATRHGLRVPSARYMATLDGLGWGQGSLGLDTPLSEGDCIHIFPPVSGG